jgi:hypothetical protein
MAESLPAAFESIELGNRKIVLSNCYSYSDSASGITPK